jgi:hypothetical protein
VCIINAHMLRFMYGSIWRWGLDLEREGTKLDPRSLIGIEAL